MPANLPTEETTEDSLTLWVGYGPAETLMLLLPRPRLLKKTTTANSARTTQSVSDGRGSLESQDTMLGQSSRTPSEICRDSQTYEGYPPPLVPNIPSHTPEKRAKIRALIASLPLGSGLPPGATEREKLQHNAKQRSAADAAWLRDLENL